MIEEVVEKYLKIFPADAPKLHRLLEQLGDHEELDDRRNFKGHLAGDAFILSPDLSKFLMIYHVRYKRWNQPGGHWDKGEEGPWLTSEREAFEETGLKGLRRLNLSDDFRIPFHIITGFVEASQAKNEPDHWHHDFRYAFVATSEDLPEINDEGVAGSRWFPVNEVKGTDSLMESMDRLINLTSSHKLKA